jgi:hypothetical protein
MLKFSSVFASILLILILCQTGICQGLAPEQIYQSSVDAKALIGTWEILPDENPLAEKEKNGETTSPRVLMAIRKDGTCRIFNADHPAGADATWVFEDHELVVTFKNSNRIDFFVYGIKSDFMVARSPVKNGKDQLWSRVK